MRKILIGVTIAGTLVCASGSALAADTVGPVTFEQPDYHVGDINGQQGWMKTDSRYDVAVVDSIGYPSVGTLGFGSQALRLSNGYADGAFGGQTFTPPISPAAGELTGRNHFDASFSIGSTQATRQLGMFMSVSPDDGTGNRMSWVGFDDQANGIHVIFEDVTDPGPLGHVADFKQKDVATIDRTHAHTIAFSIDFKPGPNNDVVKLSVDGAVKATGHTWEDYYRYDPEQSGNGNVVPNTFDLEFREGGSSVPVNTGHGYLVDNVSLGSANSGDNAYCGTTLPDGTYYNVVVPAGATCVLDSGDTVQHDVNVQKGGTLIDIGAWVGNNIKADHPAGFGLYAYPYVGHDVSVDGVTGNTGYLGDTHNYVCSATIGHDLVVQNSAGTAGAWSIGGADCGLGNQSPDGGIGHNLVVQKNANPVDVSRNQVGNDMNVSGNTGGTLVNDNHAGHDAVCSGNNPAATGGGNYAPHVLTCPV